MRQINDKVSTWWFCVIEVFKKSHMACIKIKKKNFLKIPKTVKKSCRTLQLKCLSYWNLLCLLFSNRGSFWIWYLWPISLRFSPHTVVLTCDRHFVTQVRRRAIGPNISKVILCIKDPLVKASMYCSTFLWPAQPTPRTPHPQNSIQLPVCDSWELSSPLEGLL